MFKHIDFGFATFFEVACKAIGAFALLTLAAWVIFLGWSVGSEIATGAPPGAPAAAGEYRGCLVAIPPAGSFLQNVTVSRDRDELGWLLVSPRGTLCEQGCFVDRLPLCVR